MKLSVVAVGRNDGYGGDFLGHITNCFASLSSLKDYEFIVVEWNPPLGRPSLKETLPNARVIQVPSEIHNCFPKSDRIPVFEYRGKNVGILRAKGDFVLVTNPDDVFSPELIEWLNTAKFDSDCFYRAPRHDLSETGQVRRRQGYKGSGLFFNASGDFLLMAKKKWQELRGYAEISSFCHLDSYMLTLAASSGLKQIVLPYPTFHQFHGQEPDRPHIEWEHGKILMNKGPWGLPDENLVEL